MLAYWLFTFMTGLPGFSTWVVRVNRLRDALGIHLRDLLYWTVVCKLVAWTKLLEIPSKSCNFRYS